jgi:hypothetical protein
VPQGLDFEIREHLERPLPHPSRSEGWEEEALYQGMASAMPKNAYKI